MNKSKSNKPLVSIIIPCFNVEKYIEQCIDSVILQSYDNIEIICINNNSTDETSNKLKKLRIKHPQIIIDDENRLGASSARNKGLSISKGDWIQFLDADDCLLPDKINHQVFLINNNISFIVGAYVLRKNSSQVIISVNDKDNIWVNLAKGKLGNTCSNLFSKKWLNTILGWDETLKSSQEYDLMLRLLHLNAEVIFDNEPLTIINQTPNSITTSPANKVNNIVRRSQLLNRIKLHAESINLPNLNIKEIEQALFDVTREMNLYDINLSEKMYSDYFNRNYKPIKSLATTQKYIILHSLLGFTLAHAIIRFLKTIK